MNSAKIFFITLAINSILLPFYSLTAYDFQSIVHVAEMGLLDMFIPTLVIAITFVLLQKAMTGRSSSSIGKLILTIFVLLIVNIGLQLTWSWIVANNPMQYVIEFYSFYFIWTLLSCILIPTLSRFYLTPKIKMSVPRVSHW